MYSSNIVLSFDCRDNEVSELISDYKKNMNSFCHTIEKYIQNDNSLKHYFTNVISNRSRVTSIDKIKADKTIQKNYSGELKKYIQFYNNVICEENEFLYDDTDVETSINILYSTDEKLNNKLQEIYNKYELGFKQKLEQKLEQKFEINNYTISFPKEKSNEENRINFSNLSLRD